MRERVRQGTITEKANWATRRIYFQWTAFSQRVDAMCDGRHVAISRTLSTIYFGVAVIASWHLGQGARRGIGE